jgi:predicted RNA-binding Zn-ribbon protein involved in translation (DUF1610 family)
MSSPSECPSCKKAFKGPAIPEASQHFFGGAECFSTAIAIYDRLKDRTVAWRCPHCQHQWERVR